MARPDCHEKAVILCQVIEPDSIVTGVKFYLCSSEGCGRIWNDDGVEFSKGA